MRDRLPSDCADLERPLVQHLRAQRLQHRQRPGQRDRPAGDVQLEPPVPDRVVVAAGVIFSARSSGPVSCVQQPQVGDRLLGPGSSPCSPRRTRRRSGTARRRCPGPRRRHRRRPRPAGPPRCGWCRAAPWSAPSDRAGPGSSGSVLTVKCTAASRESPTLAVYRMPVPLNASTRICCIASRQSVVYRSRGRYTITETNRPNGSGCRKARSRRRLASCSTLPTTSTTRSGLGPEQLGARVGGQQVHRPLPGVGVRRGTQGGQHRLHRQPQHRRGGDLGVQRARGQHAQEPVLADAPQPSGPRIRARTSNGGTSRVSAEPVDAWVSSRWAGWPPSAVSR